MSVKLILGLMLLTAKLLPNGVSKKSFSCFLYCKQNPQTNSKHKSCKLENKIRIIDKENTNPRPISTKIHRKSPPTESNLELPIDVTSTVRGGSDD